MSQRQLSRYGEHSGKNIPTDKFNIAHSTQPSAWGRQDKTRLSSVRWGEFGLDSVMQERKGKAKLF